MSSSSHALQRTIICALFFLITSIRTWGTEIIPLSEIKKGMVGEWKTVVEGNELKTFTLEVLGIQENFAGPRQPVIICKALDAEHITSGPVAGMSGSPVYFDGKLAGAYAYGYLWPKEQALIGVTPIEKMLEVWDIKPTPGETTASYSSQENIRIEATNLPAMQEGLFSSEYLRTLPAPLSFSGISQKTLAAFSAEFEKLGCTIQMNGSDHASSSTEATHPMEPGYPVAGVLMQGDFSVSGVGTITWKEGDRLLGFGHPFMQAGDIAMPMAGAEIITIVQNQRSSFKLSNTGPVVGTITQDRLTAIAGVLGEAPRMIPLQIQITDETTETYRAEIFNHRSYSPIMNAIALLEVLGSTLQVQEKGTLTLDYELQIDDHPAISYRQFISGYDQAQAAAVSFQRELSLIWNNPFKSPTTAAVNISITRTPAIRQAMLEEVRLSRQQLSANDPLSITLTLNQFQDKPFEQKHELTIPADAAGRNITLTICDARRAARILEQNRSIESFSDLLTRISENLPNNVIHIFLTTPSSGLAIEGEVLTDLPPSMITLLGQKTSFSKSKTVSDKIIYHQTIPLSSFYQGSFSKTFSIEP